jgi:dTDP-4-amino-4,6-dideoxygalactose transaminase
MFQPLLPLKNMSISRAEFVDRMKDLGIGVGIHYPALHLFTLYRERGYKAGMYPHAEHVGATTVSLPLFPGMKDEDVDRVCAALVTVLKPVLKN